MISPTLTRLLQILTFILLFTQQSFSKNDRKTYIVYMGEYPNEMESAESLHTSMVRSVLDSKFAPDALLHSYKSFNALVARLTKEEAVRMRGMEGVVSVIPDRNHKLLTSRSWDFIGFPENVKRANIESDIIVGVIDSGISPKSDSFNGEGFGTPPQKWKGTCQNISCNNKIVGAKYFRISGVFGKDDIISPVDTNGHGTHCTSTAAGNPVASTSLFGYGLGTVRGGVPLARIASYKVSWNAGLKSADVLAAFDTAIADGVDILSVSLGPPGVKEIRYFDDVFAIGAFHALKKGILTSHAAGNEGPKTASITNTAPWLLSVTATTIDRQFFANVQLGNGDIYQGISVNPFDLENKFYPLIYGGDAANVTGGFNSSVSRYCVEAAMDKTLVKGKILLCDDYPYSVVVGSGSGAIGVIYRTNTSLAGSDIYALPAVHVRQNNGTAIYSYLKSTSNPTATISISYQGKDPLAPYIDSYSSRGPNKLTPNVLKPDLAAPGTNILAAWSPIPPISGINGDKRMENYKIVFGTSMACPHAAAAAAYVKSFHPTWSPGAIKSALMTTATTIEPALNGDTEFAYGAGQINPLKAVNPGLVYDVNQIDYVNFLCGQGYTNKQLRKITGDTSACTQANKGAASDLNLPSFALSTTRQKNTTLTFSRTVTNVGSANSTYKSTITTPPSSLSIKVVPDVLQFSSLGENKTFTLTIEGSINDKTVSSSLVWDDGTFHVRSPIIVYDPKETLYYELLPMKKQAKWSNIDGFSSWFASSSY